METRNVQVSLATAREWYKSGNKALKEVTLQAFTEEELKGVSYKEILDFKDACDALGLCYKDELATIKKLKAISAHTAAIYGLDIVRKALNGGEIPSLVSGSVYYPWVRFYPTNNKPDSDTLRRNGYVLADKFTHAGKSYILVGGDCNYYCSYGVGAFGGDDGGVSANAGLLCCKSREIAQHMSKHFAKLIFEAVYAQYDFVEWDD